MSVRGQPEGDFGAICHNARPGTGANFEFRVSLMRLNQSGNYAGEQTLASLLLSILILIYRSDFYSSKLFLLMLDTK